MKRQIFDTNRSMKRHPHRVSGWCMGCDAAKVSPGQKCRVCGSKEKPGRNKKEINVYGNVG